MDRLKTFIWYFIIFAALFLVMWLLTTAAMIRPSNAVTYKIDFDSPTVTISEAKATGPKVHIGGKVTNNSGSSIDIKYLRFDFYNSQGVYLGTKSQELKNFHVNEKNNINIYSMYSYTDVNAVEISLVDEKPADVDNNMWDAIFNPDYSNIYIIGGAILAIYLLLPPW